MNVPTLTLGRPDDWHLHLRDGAALRAVLPHTAARFARAIVMPNLKPPVTTTAMAAQYRAASSTALPAGAAFEPLMTLYLTDRTPLEEVDRARDSGIVHGFKLYPAGATTHSDAGVTDIAQTRRSAGADGAVRHGAAGARRSDARSGGCVRARGALHRRGARAAGHPPSGPAQIVFEHITTRVAVNFVRSARAGIGATITPQHLLHNRNAMLAGGIRPHFYCLPVLKTEPDRHGPARCRHQRRAALLPRHRQRTARPQRQGIGLRLRGHVFGARGHRALCRSLRGCGRAAQA